MGDRYSLDDTLVKITNSRLRSQLQDGGAQTDRAFAGDARYRHFGPRLPWQTMISRKASFSSDDQRSRSDQG